jgi:hypothetical protein
MTPKIQHNLERTNLPCKKFAFPPSPTTFDGSRVLSLRREWKKNNNVFNSKIMINRELIVVKNLAVYLIEGKERLSREYVTFEEAMDRQLIVLRETGKVGELTVDNPSDKYVFVMSGDIVRGGRQRRRKCIP